MTLRDLTLQELHHLHRHELREAFPPEELKPFAAMKKLYRAGVYHPVGAWEGETLVGYALLWEAPQRKYVLIDYLGVTAARRNGGLGSVILEKVRNSGKLGYGFDAYKEEYCDMIASGIVDPAKVTRSALENAASVSGMVLTTESLVADKPQPPAPAAPAPEMGGMGGMY